MWWAISGVTLIVITVILWFITDMQARNDHISNETFVKMQEAENSTWKYNITETTITSGCPVLHKK